MLKLFANIFELLEPEQNRLSEQLIAAATERAIDGTDPRLRILHGYSRQLRDPIVHATGHILGLIESLPAPVTLTPGKLPSHADLSAIFYSAERLSRILAADPALRDYREAESGSTDPIDVLLTVRQREKRGFGTALVDGEARSDVAQTTITFYQHQFLDPSARSENADRLLQRRAFDALLAIALQHITERRGARDHLVQRRALLRAKLAILKRHGGFVDQHAADEKLELQRRMDDIESEMHALGPDEAVLTNNLATLTDVLERAEQHLWLEELPQCLDRYYVLHKPGEDVPELSFSAICDSNEDRVLVRRMRITPPFFS